MIHLQKKKNRLLVILALLFFLGMMLSLFTGPAKTGWKHLLDLFSQKNSVHSAIFQIRLTRALLAFLVGASLSLSGAILQGYFQNPMAGPFVVGVSSGASFGAVLSIQLGLTFGLLGLSLQSVFAFVSGFAIVYFVYLLSQRGGIFKVETLLLTGIAAGALASALTSLLIFLKSDSYEQAVFWLLGSFHYADWKQISTILPIFFLCFLIAQSMAKDMNLLVLGDDTAQSLGCPVKKRRRTFLALSTLLAASAVSVSGIIGFVGLIVPHWIRLIIGPNHRSLFFYSSFTGGIFLIFCDLMARSLLFSSELPIGIFTAIIGAPFFIYLLSKTR
jgi:iron complex transport system permease protein